MAAVHGGGKTVGGQNTSCSCLPRLNYGPLTSFAAISVQLYVAASALSKAAQCMTVCPVIVTIVVHGASDLPMLCSGQY